jgi:hypothetical protein
MSICHRALAVMEGSPSRGRRMRLRPGGHNSSSSLPLTDSEFVDATRNHINKDFLVEVTQTEELTSCIGYIYGYYLFGFSSIALINLPRCIA